MTTKSQPTAAEGALVLRAGRVVDPASGRDEVADVIVREGVIEGVERPGVKGPEGALELSAEGCLVLPGGVDLCTYVRAPGREEEEPLAATLRGAVRGGVTTLLAMPSTRPATDGADDVGERLAAAAAVDGGARMLVAGCLSARREGKELAEIGEMTRAGAVAFTDAPDAVADAELLRRAMEYARGFGRPVIANASCPSLGGRGVVHESALSTRLGLAGIPEAAETSFVARHLELCRLTGARTHLGALSSARSVAMLRRALDEGLLVSAEVHPYHLLLDESAHRERPYDTALHLRPPLRSPADREALLEGVRDGILAIASGHAPVGPEGKELELAASEPGAVSLPFLFPLLSALLADAGGGLSPLALANATSRLPARILGLDESALGAGRLAKGAPADLVVLDLTRGSRVDEGLLGDGARNSPWLHRETRGSVRLTLKGGAITYRAPDANRGFHA